MRVASGSRAVAVSVGALVVGMVTASPASAAAEWRTELRMDESSQSSYSEVAASGARNAWAVGQAGADYEPFAHRYDGRSWQPVSLPPDAGDGLVDVDTTSADSAWLVPVDYETLEGSKVLQWDGSGWTTHEFPDVTTGSISALAPDDAWYVARKEVGSGVIAYHWDGNEWSERDLPGQPEDVANVDARSADDVWVGGTRDQQPYLAHFDGEQWRDVPMPEHTPPDGAEEYSFSLRDVVSVSADEAWAIGNSSWDDGSESFVYEFDGTEWRSVPAPDTGEYSDALVDVGAGPNGSTWLAPDDGSNAFERAGDSWRRSPVPEDDGTATSVRAITSAGGRMWAVGAAEIDGDNGYGTIYRAR